MSSPTRSRFDQSQFTGPAPRPDARRRRRRRLRPSTSVRCSARLPRSAPTKSATKASAGAARISAGRRRLRDLAAVLHDDDLVAEQERLVDVVRHEHDRLAEFALQAQQLLLQLGAHDRVDGAERLVHEQDVRVDREPAGDADALLLAARELARVLVGERPVEPDRVEQLERPGVRLALALAAEQRHGGDVVDHLAVRQQAGVLHHVADAAAQLHRDRASRHPCRR